MSENKDDQIVITEDFKSSVVNWVSIDDKIKELNNKIKELKEEKKEDEAVIINYLEKYKQDMIDITGGKLKKNITKTQTPLKKDLITSALNELINDSNKAVEMTDYIFSKRQTKEKINLRRMKNKN